jgi:hypothetical protein
MSQRTLSTSLPWTISAAIAIALLVPCDSVEGQRGQVAPPELSLIPELRLDPTRENFSVIGSVTVGPAGEIVVPQLQEGKFLFFSRSGQRVTEFGRKGTGPGEFYGANPFVDPGWVGDTLWLYDGRASRFTLVSTSGNLVRIVRLTPGLVPATDRFPAMSPRTPTQAYFGDGSTLVMADMRAPYPRGFDTTSRPLIKLSPARRTERIVARVPWDMARTDPMVRVVGFVWAARQLFYVLPVFTVSRDGAYIAVATTSTLSSRGGNYRLTLLRTSGDTVFSRVYQFEGNPIPRDVIDRRIAAIIADGPPNIRASLPELTKRMPPVYPPVHQILIGRDGTVWIGGHVQSGGQTWTALDPRGELFGTITLPVNTAMSVVSRSHIWVTERDADDLETVVRYRIGERTGDLRPSPGR